MAAGPVGFVPCRGEQKEQKEEHKTQTKGVGQLAVKMATLSISSPSSSSSSVQAKPGAVSEQQAAQAARLDQLRKNISRNAKFVYDAVCKELKTESTYVKNYATQHKKNPEGTHLFSYMGSSAGLRAQLVIEQARKLFSFLPQPTVSSQKDATLVMRETASLIRQDNVAIAYITAISQATNQEKGDVVEKSPLVIAHVFDVNRKNPLR